jgi:imidazoleglycerol-phosphate dehydratase
VNLAATRETDETTVTVDLLDAETAKQRETRAELDVTVDWDEHGGLDEDLDPGMAEHQLEALLYYADLVGDLEATGDLAHHVVEDAALTLGQAIRERVQGEPIQRFAEATRAMDDALVQVVLDAGDRPYADVDLDEHSPLFHHVCRTLAFEARCTLHVRVLRGFDDHHVVEATMKAMGTALGEALAPAEATRSTKGSARTGDAA